MKRIELTIDDMECSLDRISLVSEPAIEVDFFYFSKDKMKFHLEKEKQMITAPAMIPDLDLLRTDPISGEQFMVYFSKETIQKCVELFFKNSDVTSTNIEHKFLVDDIIIMESWFIDSEFNKSGGKNFEGLPDGSWMVSMKIDNKMVWDELIKTGKVRGLSIEGIFSQKFNKVIKHDTNILFDKIKDIISKLD